MSQTSKRPQQQTPPQLAVVPKTHEGQRIAAKIATKQQDLQELAGKIQQIQQQLEQGTRMAINLEGQLVALREELEEVEKKKENPDGEQS